MNYSFNLFKSPQERNFFDYLTDDYLLERYLFPLELKPIVDLFSEDCNDSLCKVHIFNSRLFIEGGNGDERNELMLRFGDSRLRVARVEFIHKRIGNMDRLYELLKDIQRIYELKPIELEVCETESIRNWCNKHQFVELMNNNFVEKV